MELYLANNKIKILKDVNALQDLPKLIILDISGNICSKDPNYRVSTLFSLKRLKVKIKNFNKINIKMYKYIYRFLMASQSTKPNNNLRTTFSSED